MNEQQQMGIWRKSSHSGGSGGECVEVAHLTNVVGVRDSKIPESPVITPGAQAWSAFLAATAH
ncbi:DUF397 domain-containing protein [Embleya sp. MST-111070]|uniref:DUF397 domain-containing protein n=1 Tax=Embleya sp. MST-111070 TaxID=3398231 RepID=UPI003F73339D